MIYLENILIYCLFIWYFYTVFEVVQPFLFVKLLLIFFNLSLWSTCIIIGMDVFSINFINSNNKLYLCDLSCLIEIFLTNSFSFVKNQILLHFNPILIYFHYDMCHSWISSIIIIFLKTCVKFEQILKQLIILIMLELNC